MAENGPEKPQDDPQAQDTGEPENGPETDLQGQDGSLTKDDGTPFTRKDLDALHDALRKARREAKRAKSEQPTETKPDDGPDAKQAAEQATKAAEGKWKPLMVKAAARSAFVEAGLTLPRDGADTAMGRVLKMLDMDDLEITDDGQVDGLREQVEDIRRDFPELFATAARRPARVDGADKPGQQNAAPKTSAERIAAGLLGGR